MSERVPIVNSCMQRRADIILKSIRVGATITYTAYTWHTSGQGSLVSHTQSINFNPPTFCMLSRPLPGIIQLSRIGNVLINTRISAVLSTTKLIAPFSCTPRVQEVHTRVEVVKNYPWSPRLRGIIQLSRIGNVLRNI